jgi:protease-4
MKRENKIILSLIGLFLLSIFIGSLKTGNDNSEFSTSASFMNSKAKFGIVHLYGPISIGAPPSQFNPYSVENIIQNINSFAKDKSVKALIIRINSPGGTVGASQELFQALKNYKAETGAPIVVSIGDVGASGAYWVSMAADAIFANEGSLVGSIGVIISSPDLTKATEKFGIGMNTFTSGPYKDILSMFRDMREDEQVIVQELIDDVHMQFIEVVAKGRNKSIAEAKKYADGRIFTGKQAVKAGLIDQTGSLQDAIDYTKIRTGITGEVELVTVEENSLQHMLKIVKKRLNSQINLPFQNSGLGQINIQAQ